MVYLLHFDEPFKHAKHYLGYTGRNDINYRMKEHSSGRGSKLMAAVSAAGIKFTIAKVWEDGDRTFERKIKNQKNTPRFCPICNKTHKGGINA